MRRALALVLARRASVKPSRLLLSAETCRCIAGAANRPREVRIFPSAVDRADAGHRAIDDPDARCGDRERRARAHRLMMMSSIDQAGLERWMRTRGAMEGTEARGWTDWRARAEVRFKSGSAGGREETVVVPSMGDSITEGSLVRVLKSVGDEVATDEVVAQIETDKVTIDVRAPSSGVVTRVDAKEGDTVAVGQAVMIFSLGGGGGKKAAKGGSSVKAEVLSGELVGVEVPSMGDSITEGSVASVLVRAGKKVAVDEVIAQIETDKVTIDVRASTSGTVTEVLAKEGETVSVGQKVASIAPGPGPEKQADAASKPEPAMVAKAAPAEKATATAAKASRPIEATAARSTTARSETRVPMSRLRMRVAERLKSSQNTYAMLTTFNEIDMTSIMQMRAEYKDAFLEKHGVKLGFMSTFVKAAAKALQEEPSVNAIIDGDEIVYRNYVDISVAVSAPKGLVVPVLRNCEQMKFSEVEGAIASYGKKARDGTLSIDEMAGGTFTISNGGVFGSLTGTPIINPPQSAILGMHSIVWRPVCVGADRNIVARPMMNVALTYDHRLVDGREAVTFLKSIKQSVEDPRRMLLEL